MNIQFTAAGVARNVMKGLAAHADIVRRPALEEASVGPSVALARGALEGLTDSPQSLAMVMLRQWAWPGPFSRNPMGELDHLDKLTAVGLRDDHAHRWQPRGAVLSMAGDVEPGAFVDEAKRLFDGWPPGEAPRHEITPPPGKFHHVEQDSQQTHIALSYPTVPETADDYYLARLAVECLSGGMSGRLFDRIRERRGLCYSVYASYTSLAGPDVAGDDFASVMCYAGTSNERAQETLDALVHELGKISEGVTEEELHRAKIGLKAGTVMSGESSSARAGSLARDWLTRGRLRTLEEILAAIDGITLADLNAWLAAHPATDFTTVLIGPEALSVPPQAA